MIVGWLNLVEPDYGNKATAVVKHAIAEFAGTSEEVKVGGNNDDIIIIIISTISLFLYYIIWY